MVHKYGHRIDFTMTRSELIEQLARRFPSLVAADAKQAVSILIDAITSAMAHGERVEIRGFGSFSTNLRKPRIGRNPKTGERVEVPVKVVPHFKAGKEMREAVDL
jgi:integration host factor subunit beta